MISHRCECKMIQSKSTDSSTSVATSVDDNDSILTRDAGSVVW